MRTFWRFTTIIFCIVFFSCTAEKQKLNVLWIVADDLGADLHCYGESQVYTPHLDRLASDGVLYNNFFTVTAVCSPSRSSLITGMYPVSIDCQQHRTQYKKELPDDVEPITKYFRDNGYFTFNGDYRNKDNGGKWDYNFIAENIYDGTHWSQCPADKPFFGQIQIFFPHRPFKRDPERPIDPERLEIPPYYPDHEVTRRDWADYLEYIQLLDKAVGQVLKQLEDDGLLSNTLVIFMGDQGRPHVRGKQFLYDGGTQTPLIIRYPDGKKAGILTDRLVSNIDLAAATLNYCEIDKPSHIQGIDFLNDDSPERQYVFTMRDRRDETVDRIRAIRSKEYKYIRNFYPERPYLQFNAYKKFRYPVLTLMEVLKEQGELNETQLLFMEDVRPAEELYNLKSDPFEIRNLVDDSNYSQTLSVYRAAMDSCLTTYDMGKYPEDVAEIQYADSLMKNNYAKWMKGIGLNENTSNDIFLEYWEKYLGISESN